MLHIPHEKEMKHIRNDVALQIAQHGYIKFDYPMKSKTPGKQYGSIYQIWQTPYTGDFLYDVVRGFLYLTQDLPHFQMVGRMWSSIPILSAIAVVTNRSAVFIRRERKDYGPMNEHEGQLNPDIPALIIDDIANSSESFAFCQEYLRNRNIPVLDQCFAIMNKKSVMQPGYKWDKYSQQEIISIVNKDMIDEKLARNIH